MFLTRRNLRRIPMIIVITFFFPTWFVRSLNVDLKNHWKVFKNVYDKTYSNKNEELERQKIFEEHVVFIIKHNLQADMGKHTFRLGINQLSDLGYEEYSQLNSADGVNTIDSGILVANKFINKTALAETKVTIVDYRDKGMISPVANQGLCVCSYAFAAAGALESQMKKVTGKLIPLSPQNIIDCSDADGNEGCQNGTAINSFKYILRNRGIDSEDSYPYTSVQGPCNYKPQNKSGYLRKIVKVPADESSLLNALIDVGPIAVIINGDFPEFQDYKSGIYQANACDDSKLTTSLLVVGLGTDGSTHYWIAKNSFGKTWGEDGYIRILKGKNMCGITSAAVYPVVT